MIIDSKIILLHDEQNLYKILNKIIIKSNENYLRSIIFYMEQACAEPITSRMPAWCNTLVGSEINTLALWGLLVRVPRASKVELTVAMMLDILAEKIGWRCFLRFTKRPKKIPVKPLWVSSAGGVANFIRKSLKTICRLQAFLELLLYVL